MLPAALEYPSGIEMLSVCTGLLGEEGRVNTTVDTRLITEYLYISSVARMISPLHLSGDKIYISWHYNISLISIMESSIHKINNFSYSMKSA